MGKHDGHEEEEWILFLFFDEPERFFLNKVLRIGAEPTVVVFGKPDHCLVTPQVVRIVVMCHKLAVVAEEMVHALIHRITGGTGETKAPFTESTGGISGILKQMEKRVGAGGQWKLSFRLYLLVSADGCMSGV